MPSREDEDAGKYTIKQVRDAINEDRLQDDFVMYADFSGAYTKLRIQSHRDYLSKWIAGSLTERESNNLKLFHTVMQELVARMSTKDYELPPGFKIERRW